MRSRKFIFFILLVFIGIGTIKAETATVEYLDGIYSNRISDDKVYSGKLGYLIIDGKVVYCLEPYLIVGKDYTLNNNYLNNFSKEDLDYFEMIANYVEDQVNNRNVYYYMAAQELIWERIIGDKVYWTAEKNGSVEININAYKQEIQNYLNKYSSGPSFNKKVVYDEYFSTIILEDSKKILNEYEIVSDTKSIARIEDNKLYIKILSTEEEEIKMVRKKEGDSSYYYSDGNQDLVYLSGFETEAYVKVKATNNYSTNLNVNFYDSQLNTLIDGGIKFMIHNLETDEYIDQLITYNGKFESMFKLECGRYELTLLDVPKNYLIDSKYEFEIKEESFQDYYEINFYLNKAYGNITINNYKENTTYDLYAAENIYNIHNNIVHKKDELLASENIFKENNFNIDVSLGKYYVLDQSNQKKHEICLDYKDPFTKVIYYNLNIYEESKINDKQESENIQDNETDKNDNYLNNVEEKDNIEDKLSDSNINNNMENKIDLEDNKQNKVEDIFDNPILFNSLKNEEINNNIEVLPNTYNYIGFFKIFLGIVILGCTIKLRVNNND